MKTNQPTTNARTMYERASDAYNDAVAAFLKHPSPQNEAAVKFAKAETVARYKAFKANA